MGGSIQGVPLTGLETVSTLAGEPVMFEKPSDLIVIDNDLYIADLDNFIMLMDKNTGEASYYAGSSQGGYRNAPRFYARFTTPGGICSDGTNIYISEFSTHTIRKIDSSGWVTNLAGESGTSGSADSSDGTGSTARFNAPTNMVVSGGYLYVTDFDNHTIRKIDVTTGETTTLAGTAGSTGTTDGTGSSARFKGPGGIAVDATGINLYVADYNNNSIRQVQISDGAVTTVAGAADGSSGTSDGTGTAARFYGPADLVFNGTDLYVTENDNHSVRKIDTVSSFEVTTIAGLKGTSGYVDGAGTSARFNIPSGIDTDGTYLYIADYDNHAIRRIAISDGTTNTVRKSSLGTSPLHGPHGVTTDDTYLYVADAWDFVVKKVDIASGAVSVLAGTPGTSGSADSTDGTGATATFGRIYGITTDGTDLYVTDANSTIRKVNPTTGETVTLAGTAGADGSTDSTDGTGATATFFIPFGITYNGSHLYVTDWYTHIVRRIDPVTGETVTVAGSAGNTGSTDGTGASARFYNPAMLTTDGSYLYIADVGNHTIRQMDIGSSEVTIFAGTTGTMGIQDGTGTAAVFADMAGITTDGFALYLADFNSHAIRKIDLLTKSVTTITDFPTRNGYLDGSITSAKFLCPYGITNTEDSLFITELGNGDIRMID